MNNRQSVASVYNFSFWSHLFLTALSWFLPFLVSWWLAILAYSIVLLQFALFNRCLMNEGHGLDDGQGEATFYGFLLERIGIRPDRQKLKRFVRRDIYVCLTVIAIVWQLVLGHEPMWFFK
jgi:hypothetical protein